MSSLSFFSPWFNSGLIARQFAGAADTGGQTPVYYRGFAAGERSAKKRYDSGGRGEPVTAALNFAQPGQSAKDAAGTEVRNEIAGLDPRIGAGQRPGLRRRQAD
jgi:hypothetical protein